MSLAIPANALGAGLSAQITPVSQSVVTPPPAPKVQTAPVGAELQSQINAVNPLPSQAGAQSLFESLVAEITAADEADGNLADKAEVLYAEMRKVLSEDS